MAGPTSLVRKQEVSLAVDPEDRLVEHARTQPGTQIGGWLGDLDLMVVAEDPKETHLGQSLCQGNRLVTW